MVLPPVQFLEADEFLASVQPFDILLIRSGFSQFSKFIGWGQQFILQKLGVPAATAKELSHYAHALVTTGAGPFDGFEAAPPVVSHCDIRYYGKCEWLRLRPKEPFTNDEIAVLRSGLLKWEGISYDRTQYFVYPFYMAWGWSPGWWSKWWDDPEKPVCSGLCVRLYRLTGRLSNAGPYVELPPARLPTLDELQIVDRMLVDVPEPIKDLNAPLPWWLR